MALFLWPRLPLLAAAPNDETREVSDLAKETRELKEEVRRLREAIERLEKALGGQASLPYQQIRFTAIFVSQDGKRAIGEFTPAGPIAKSLRPLPGEITKLAIDTKGNRVFGRGHHEVYQLSQDTTESKELKVGGDAPEMSWLSAVAFDSKRNRVLASTFGGGGYLYTFDPQMEKWSVICKPGLGVGALAYAETEDSLYGVNLTMGMEAQITRLYTFNAHGAKTAERELSQPIATGGDFGHTQLIWTDGWLVLIQSQPSVPHAGKGPPIPKAYIISPMTGNIVYSGEVTPR